MQNSLVSVINWLDELGYGRKIEINSEGNGNI